MFSTTSVPLRMLLIAVMIAAMITEMGSPRLIGGTAKLRPVLIGAKAVEKDERDELEPVRVAVATETVLVNVKERFVARTACSARTFIGALSLMAGPGVGVGVEVWGGV